MKRKFYELNLYSYIFYRHLENTIILTWEILILASFSVILDSDLGFQNRFSGKCTRFFWVANPSKKNTVKIGVKNYVEPCIFQPILNFMPQPYCPPGSAEKLRPGFSRDRLSQAWSCSTILIHHEISVL